MCYLFYFYFIIYMYFGIYLLVLSFDLVVIYNDIVNCSIFFIVGFFIFLNFSWKRKKKFNGKKILVGFDWLLEF